MGTLVPMQSVHVTTKVMSSNPAHARYTRSFVRLTAGRWFSPGIPVSPTYKDDRHNITEILLMMVLNTKTLTQRD